MGPSTPDGCICPTFPLLLPRTYTYREDSISSSWTCIRSRPPHSEFRVRSELGSHGRKWRPTKWATTVCCKCIVLMSPLTQCVNCNCISHKVTLSDCLWLSYHCKEPRLLCSILDSHMQLSVRLFSLSCCARDFLIDFTLVEISFVLKLLNII